MRQLPSPFGKKPNRNPIAASYSQSYLHDKAKSNLNTIEQGLFSIDSSHPSRNLKGVKKQAKTQNAAVQMESKLKEMDFDFVFFEEYDSQKIDKVTNLPQVSKQNSYEIDKMNGITKRHEGWLKNQMSKMSTAFVISKLSALITEQEPPPTSSGPQPKRTDQHLCDLNKVNWSQLFMRQPHIKNLLLDYFEQLVRFLNLEFHNNREQILNYVRFPRRVEATLQLFKNRPAGKSAQGARPQKLPEQFIQKLQSLEVDNPSTTFAKAAQQHKNLTDAYTSKVNSARRNNTEDARGDQRVLTQASAHKDGKGQLSRFGKPATATGAENSEGDGGVLGFLDKIPKIIKEKNLETYESLREFVLSDDEAMRKFTRIVNNKKALFGEKLEALLKLQDDHQQTQCAKKNQRDIKLSLSNMSERLEVIENETNNIENMIQMLEDVSQLDKIRKKRPTEKLRHTLDGWFQKLEDQHMDEFEQQKFTKEFWEIGQSFEEQIRKEEKGWEIEKARFTAQAINRERKLKEHFMFRIEALETALQETKLEAARRVDRSEMEMNDLLSHQMNLQAEGFYENIDAFIEEEKRGFKELGLMPDPPDKPTGYHKGRGKRGATGSKVLVSKKKSTQHDTLTSVKSIEEPTTFRNQKQTPMKTSHGNRSQFTKDRSTTPVTQSSGPLREVSPIAPERMEALQQHLNKYFRIMKSQQFNQHRANIDLRNERRKTQEAQEAKDRTLQKCIKYQDLASGILGMLGSICADFKLADSGALTMLQQLSVLDEGKLTMDIETITKIIQRLGELKLDQHLTAIKKKIHQSDETIGQFAKGIEALEGIPWYQKRVAALAIQQVTRESLSSLMSNKRPQPGRDEEALMIKAVQDLLELTDAIHPPESRANSPKRSDERKNLEELKSRDKVSEKSRSPQSRQSQMLRQFTRQPTNRRDDLKSPTKIGRHEKKKSVLPKNQKQPALSSNQIHKKLATKIDEAFKSNNMIRTRKAMGVSPINFQQFEDTFNSLKKSQSMRKIMFQFDQIDKKKLTTKELKKFEKGLLNHPVGKRFFITREETASKKSPFKQSKKFNPAIEISSATSSFNSSFQSFSDDPEDRQPELEDIIKQINLQLQYVYKQIQQSQQRTVEAREEDDELIKEITGERFLSFQRKATTANKKSQNDKQIIPIDCIRMEPYQAPQLNWVPIKLLMLQNKNDQAIRMTCLALKQITAFFDFSDIRDLVAFEQSLVDKINLDFLLRHDKGTDPASEGEDLGDEFEDFETVREIISEVIEDQLGLAEELREQDQMFVDAQVNNSLLTWIRHSLRVTSTCKEFVQDLNSKFQDYVGKVVRSSHRTHGEKESNKESSKEVASGKVSGGVLSGFGSPQDSKPLSSKTIHVPFQQEEDGRNSTLSLAESESEPNVTESRLSCNQRPSQIAQDALEAPAGAKQQSGKMLKLARQEDLLAGKTGGHRLSDILQVKQTVSADLRAGSRVTDNIEKIQTQISMTSTNFRESSKDKNTRTRVSQKSIDWKTGHTMGTKQMKEGDSNQDSMRFIERELEFKAQIDQLREEIDDKASMVAALNLFKQRAIQKIDMLESLVRTLREDIRALRKQPKDDKEYEDKISTAFVLMPSSPVDSNHKKLQMQRSGSRSCERLTYIQRSNDQVKLRKTPSVLQVSHNSRVNEAVVSQENVVPLNQRSSFKKKPSTASRATRNGGYASQNSRPKSKSKQKTRHRYITTKHTSKNRHTPLPHDLPQYSPPPEEEMSPYPLNPVADFEDESISAGLEDSRSSKMKSLDTSKLETEKAKLSGNIKTRAYPGKRADSPLIYEPNKDLMHVEEPLHMTSYDIMKTGTKVSVADTQPLRPSEWIDNYSSQNHDSSQGPIYSRPTTGAGGSSQDIPFIMRYERSFMKTAQSLKQRKLPAKQRPRDGAMYIQNTSALSNQTPDLDVKESNQNLKKLMDTKQMFQSYLASRPNSRQIVSRHNMIKYSQNFQKSAQARTQQGVKKVEIRSGEVSYSGLTGVGYSGASSKQGFKAINTGDVGRSLEAMSPQESPRIPSSGWPLSMSQTGNSSKAQILSFSHGNSHAYLPHSNKKIEVYKNMITSASTTMQARQLVPQ